MKKETHLLFICKYNRFRSRVAEAYFKKINKNPKIKAKSAGVFVGSYPLSQTQVRVAKSFGININGKPEPITTQKLIWQDILVVVADNIPRSLFDFNVKRYHKKNVFLNVKDTTSGNDVKQDMRVIKEIISKIDNFYETLK